MLFFNEKPCLIDTLDLLIKDHLQNYYSIYLIVLSDISITFQLHAVSFGGHDPI